MLFAGEASQSLQSFLREQIKLTDEQIRAISNGNVVATALPTHSPSEVVVFGAVFVSADPREYAKLAFDLARMRTLAGYRGAGRVGRPMESRDLDGATLEPEDIRELKNCHPGKCNVQLPAESMREIQAGLNWSNPDVANQVNERVRKVLLGFLRRYQEGGNRALKPYHDKTHPFDTGAELYAWLSRSKARHVYLPGLDGYLLDYPSPTHASAESLFYWEKVRFGLKPTLRLNHAIAYSTTVPGGMVQVVAVKQLYASHYLQLAVDLTACVTEPDSANGRGFYLISLKASTQQGLTGFTGSIIRRIVVSRTRYAQEQDLIGIKRALESAHPVIVQPQRRDAMSAAPSNNR
jgi:hypothetical protein